MTDEPFVIVVEEPEAPPLEDSQESIFEGMVNIDLPAYKGPLDVLCFLLRRGELNTKEIPPVEVVTQVNRTIPMLAGRDILGAGSSIYYDALLLEVKSALLGKIGLPEVQLVKPVEPELESETREYQDFSKLLARRYRSWWGTFPRGLSAGDRSKPLTPVNEKTRRALFQIYLELLSRPRGETRVLTPGDEPISSRREQLIHRLPLHERKTLDEIWRGESLLDKVLTFLTLLEFASQQVVIIEQDETTGEIFLTRVKTPILPVEEESEESLELSLL